MPMSRRKFLAINFAIVALVSLGAANAQQINHAVPNQARRLPLTGVRLTGGPLKQAQDADRDYLLNLEPDRMLAFYRKRAGLEPKAQPYGGWDGDGKNLTGHIGGHYLSAVSLMYAATGDARFKTRADYLVSEMKAVQDKYGDGYLGRWPMVASNSLKSRAAISVRVFLTSTVCGRRGMCCTKPSPG